MAANMQYFVQDLQTDNGKSARKTMIGALDTLNNGDCNAATFDGKRADDYLMTVEMNSRIRVLANSISKDSKPNSSSENLLMTKGIRSILGPVPFLE